MSLRDRLSEVRTVQVTERSFPARLRDLQRVPDVLRVLGRFEADAPSVAIVGTRKADPEATEFARHLAADCARAGHIVVSGGAYGIDVAAHKGALEAGGATWVVLPTGFGRAYPARHRPFFEHVVDSGGALLSEAYEEAEPQRGRFLTRNRIIAALADAVVVVQAPLRSGALGTALHAHALGRPLYAVPSAPWDLRGAGFAQMRALGATICMDAQDVLSLGACGLPESGPQSTSENKQLPLFSEVEEQVLNHLSQRPRHPDELANLSRIDLGVVQRTILKLEIAGWVRLRPGGRYVLSEAIARLR